MNGLLSSWVSQFLIAFVAALGTGIATYLTTKRQVQEQSAATVRTRATHLNGYTDLIRNAVERIDAQRQEIEQLHLERAGLQAKLEACEKRHPSRRPAHRPPDITTG